MSSRIKSSRRWRQLGSWHSSGAAHGFRRGQGTVVGFFHLTKCQGPPRSVERIRNHCGHVERLTMLWRLGPSWPARHGPGRGDACCCESVHRLIPLRMRGVSGFVGLARSLRPLGAATAAVPANPRQDAHVAFHALPHFEAVPFQCKRSSAYDYGTNHSYTISYDTLYV